MAVGYVRVGRDEVGMDPDRRVQEAIALVFRKFAEFGSIRQVHLWLRQEGMELPAVTYGQSQRRIVWKLPVSEPRPVGRSARARRCWRVPLGIEAALQAYLVRWAACGSRVGEAVLRVLGPLGIEAALQAIEDRQRASCEVRRQAELALEAARFEEKRAHRQYDAVDPDNRLVAGELERRWNGCLQVVSRVTASSCGCTGKAAITPCCKASAIAPSFMALSLSSVCSISIGPGPASSIYALVAEGLFPRPLQVGRRAVRWIEQEVQEWLSSRPRSGTDGRRV